MERSVFNMEFSLGTLKFYRGEWPSGLRHCSKNRKVQTSLGPRRGLGTQPRYETPGDPQAENVKHSD